MKITIPGTHGLELQLTPVSTIAGDALVDVRVGDEVVRVSLRVLGAAVLGAEKSLPPPPSASASVWTIGGGGIVP